MLAAVNFPSWLHPEIFPFWPNLPLRWYGLMYLVAFGVTYFLFKYQIKQRKLNISDDSVSSFFLSGILGLILGARLFGTLLYDPSGYYWQKPWMIFWPFNETGKFTGFMGMSFHGGFVGLVVGLFCYCKKHKIEFLKWADMIAVSVPLGFTFGRLGNFINGELWGKVSTKPWAMIFPHAEYFSTSEQWVIDIAQKAGLSIQGAMINLPRHPSQLYEAFFEGVGLWLILWFIVRKYNHIKGLGVSSYIIGYGFFRFIIEYFREPDADLGYIIKLGNPKASIHYYSTPWNFSMGQILCFLMIVGGLIFLFICIKNHKKQLSLLNAAEAELNKVQKAKKKLKKSK